MADSPHITALKNQAVLKKKSAHRQRIEGGKVQHYEADVSGADAAAEEAIKAAPKIHEKGEYVPGDFVEGKGILFGQLTVKDKKTGLKKTFNMYAATEDLKGWSGKTAMSFSDAYWRLNGLQCWQGHKGTPFDNELALYAALEDGTYDGGWAIPAASMVKSWDGNGLFDNRDKAAFKGTFETAAGNDEYWTASKINYTATGYAARCHVHFGRGSTCYAGDEEKLYRCRPVRFEEVKP